MHSCLIIHFYKYLEYSNSYRFVNKVYFNIQLNKKLSSTILNIQISKTDFQESILLFKTVKQNTF
jgi:hypothetical protein